MQRLPLTLLLVAIAGCSTRAAAEWTLDDHPLQPKFHAWRRLYNVDYKSEAEEQRRFSRWVDSFYMVQAHNHEAGRRPREVTYTLGLNRFADQSWEEFKQARLMEGQNCSATIGSNTDASSLASARRRLRLGLGVGQPAAPLPESVDWREKGAVSPVKDQGSCGSCWTFSTTGALESHYYLKHGEMRLFSEQQLVDCAQAFDNNGCKGGLPSHAFEYLKYAGGIETEEDYPYTAKDGRRCLFNASEAAARVQDARNITYLSEEELVEALATVGPVSVAFDVAPDFRFYAGGVYNSQICGAGPEDVNHAVLAVGYGVDAASGLPYYIIKNSWSEDWGMDGFFWIARGSNMCGIADCASLPVMV